MEKSASRQMILVFHKPKSVVVSRKDERGRKTVYDVLPEWVRHDQWVPVGRLDRDSRGLLLFVKEKELVEKLGRPGAFNKKYEVLVRGYVQPEHVEKIKEGIVSPVGILRCEEIQIVGMASGKTRVEVILKEGKNRHMRRMFGALRDAHHGTPLKVLELKRTGFGPVALDIPSGNWRWATETERNALVGSSL